MFPTKPTFEIKLTTRERGRVELLGMVAAAALAALFIETLPDCEAPALLGSMTSLATLSGVFGSALLSIVLVSRYRNGRTLADLERNAARYQLLFENAADPMLLLQGERFIECNPRLCELWRYPREEIIGRSPADFSPRFQPDGRPSADAGRERVAAALGGEPQRFFWRHLNKDGGAVDVEVTLRAVRVGDETYLAATLRDLTEQHRTERALRQNQRTLTTLLRNLPGMAYRCANDIRCTMEFISEGCVDLTGYAAQQILGRGEIAYGELIHPDDRETRWQVVQTELRHRAPYQVTYRIRTAAGGEKWVWEQGRGVHDARGNLNALEGFISDITARKSYEQQLEYLSQYDSLTGVPNRILFSDRLHQAVAQHKRWGRRFAVHHINLDHFKDINDAKGHDIGDALLKLVAERLQSLIAETDSVARLSADEFVVLQTCIAHATDAAAFAATVLTAFQEPFPLEGNAARLTASIGIALSREEFDDCDGILREADLALAKAKEEGRNTFRFYTEELNSRARSRADLRDSLAAALEREEFLLEYQPQIDLLTNRVVGCEALVRWEHPVRGRISPAEFIPASEELGLIKPLGEFVLRKACEQAAKWRDTPLAPLTVAVNLSPIQLTDPRFAERVLAVLEETGVDPARLELEITESALVQNNSMLLEAFNRLHARGVRFSIDDFGTGYSSMQYVKQLPVQKLKIDQEFVQNAPKSGHDAAIVEMTVLLARRLKLCVVAEGVDSDATLAFVRNHGCDQGQGFFFSRPLAASEFEKYARGFGLKATQGAPHASGNSILTN